MGDAFALYSNNSFPNSITKHSMLAYCSRFQVEWKDSTVVVEDRMSG